jgi:GT2 family glycosyltransferase
MQKKPINVSVIIVRYKIKNELFDCIASIIQSKPKVSYEIVIVDNNIDERIGKELLKKFPKVIYVENSKNSGFGSGINLGVKHARGETVFVFNPDMLVYNRTLDELYLFLKKTPRLGAVASQLTDENGNAIALQGAQFLTPLRALFALSFLHKVFPNNSIAKRFYYLDKPLNSVRKVDVVPGGAFLMKRALFEKLKGFDEKFFMYFEEYDLCMRIAQMGLSNYIIPQAKVYHLSGKDTDMTKAGKIYFESRFIYFKKWYGVPMAYLVQCITTLKIKTIFMSILILFILLVFFIML